MKAEARRRELEVLPLREELGALARYYHRLQSEHEHASPGSSARRHLEDKLSRVRERFERLREEWVSEPELRDQWREFLHHRGPEPAGPPAIRRLVFKGRSEAGSIVEIRGSGEELKVEVDGALLERVAGEKDFAVHVPPARFRLNVTEFVEMFDVSPEALQALADFLDRGGSPPWEHASELLADGLIDVHFDLTPRGRRAVALLGGAPPSQ